MTVVVATAAAAAAEVVVVVVVVEVVAEVVVLLVTVHAVSNQCSTTGVTSAVVCIILSACKRTLAANRKE